MPSSEVNNADQWLPVDISVDDTAAFRIIRQVTDHTWGSDTDLSDEDILHICVAFWKLGGSWERLMNGDMSSVKCLEDSIDQLVAPRKLEETTLRPHSPS